MKRKYLTLAFAVYCALMLWLLFGQRIGNAGQREYFEVFRENISLVPLKTTIKYIKLIFTSCNERLIRHSLVNLVGNIVMFVPLGYFISVFVVNSRNFLKNILFSAGIIVIIELVQLFTLLGSLDIDDLIFNLVGTSIGYVLYRISKN